MLYSKANLKVAAVASTNPYDGALNGVQFDPDGSTVACNGSALVAVGPVKTKVHGFESVGQQGSPGTQGIVLKPDFIKEVETIIPKDKRVSLQHVAMTVGADPAKTEFTTIDKSGRVRRVAEWPKKDRIFGWRDVVRKAASPIAGEHVLKVCVGRNALLDVLQAVCDACPGSGDDPVFLEIGSGIVVRTVNRETGQRVIGVASARVSAEGWPEKDEWEKSAMPDGKVLRKFSK